MSHVELKALKAPIFGEAPVLCGSNMSKPWKLTIAGPNECRFGGQMLIPPVRLVT